MNNSFVVKGNFCQTKNPEELDLYEGAFAVCVDGLSAGIFNTLPEEYTQLPAYLTLCRKNIRSFRFMTTGTR